MSGNGRTVYIAGAGIAGLTLALALAKFGATVVVIERNRKIQEVGAGLQISPNARRILNRLGLDRALTQAAFEPAGIDVYPYRARQKLLNLELGERVKQQFGAPYAVMHRADLADILYRACKRFANIDLLFGVRAHDVVSHARGVSVTVDEADGKSRSARAFAYVGADGVHSHTRTHVLMGPAARYSGRVAWRAAVPLAALTGTLSERDASLLLGPGFHLVAYPLPQRGQMNLVMVGKVAESAAFSPKPPRGPALPWSMFPSPRLEQIAAVAADAWGFWPLSAVDTPTWHVGGVGLIGDAAHAMLPFQAQGAAMAIEDAAILAPLLMTETDGESAFRRYVALRQKRVERVKRTTRFNGFAFHLEWPFSLARDAVLRMQGSGGNLRRLAWLYGYDAAPETPAPQQRRGIRPDAH